ncbi:MAG: acetoacetate decarboxylase family protein [Dehalococcoidia bacterium]
MRTRYVKTPDQVRQLQAIYATPSFLEATSLAVTFLTEPEVVAELLPPLLEAAAEPRVSVSVYTVGASNCVGAFNGASINLACTYRGEPGLYCLTMPMSTDTAIVFGRELYAEPKKLADCQLDIRDRFVRGTVTRHGVTYVQLDGTFEEPMAPSTAAGVSKHYYYKYLPAADGQGLAGDPQLVCVTHRGRTHKLARGAATITFRESRHDPVIDLPVLKVEGASYSLGETHTTAEVVATVPARDFLPWAYGKADDLTAWGGPVVASPK